MRHEPGLQEDAKNLSLITGSALVAALLTIGLLANQMRAAPPQPEAVVHTVQPIVVEVVEIDGRRIVVRCFEGANDVVGADRQVEILELRTGLLKRTFRDVESIPGEQARGVIGDELSSLAAGEGNDGDS